MSQYLTSIKMIPLPYRLRMCCLHLQIRVEVRRG